MILSSTLDHEYPTPSLPERYAEEKEGVVVGGKVVVGPEGGAGVVVEVVVEVVEV